MTGRWGGALGSRRAVGRPVFGGLNSLSHGSVFASEWTTRFARVVHSVTQMIGGGAGVRAPGPSTS